MELFLTGLRFGCILEQIHHTERICAYQGEIGHKGAAWAQADLQR